MMNIIFVPKNINVFSNEEIKRGSAIVSSVRSFDQEEIKGYYEGNLYGAVNLESFEEKAICAAGRMLANYPTVAMRLFDMSDLAPVGEIYWDDLSVKPVIEMFDWNSHKLTQWLESC